MRVLLLLALVATASAVRERRSFLHGGGGGGGGGGGLYAAAGYGGAAYGGVYAASAPVISSYTTARELPSYVVPESTHVTTASNTIYNVRVPVTYSTTYAQPAVHTTSYYHNTGYAPVAAYNAPVVSYPYAPTAAWGVGGVVARAGYANQWW